MPPELGMGSLPRRRSPLAGILGCFTDRRSRPLYHRPRGHWGPQAWRFGMVSLPPRFVGGSHPSRFHE
eukprot:4212105-Lingulodinium_polyedra.AAC.1